MQELQSAIEALVDTIGQTSVLVEDFRPENQGRILSNLHKTVVTLDKIASSATVAGANVQIPKQLFEYVDAGKNPELFTKQLISSTVRDSEIAKGKVTALLDFHSCLEKDAIEAFPELEPVLKKTKTQ